MIFRICAHKGCNKLCKRKLCAKHERDASKSSTDGPRRIRASESWKKMSAHYRNIVGVCEDPLGLHGPRQVKAVDVHHIVPIAARPDMAFDSANVMALCRRCHKLMDIAARSKDGGEPETFDLRSDRVGPLRANYFCPVFLGDD